MTILRGSTSVRAPFVLWLALLLAIGSTVSGAGSPAPARADCGMRAPAPGIRGHQGFAFEGLVRSVEGRREPGVGWLYRVTLDVTEMLAGQPVATVAFDLGTGDCWHLQGDRFKAGDRLIVTASAPPLDGPVAYLPDGLTWRYEWSDRWSFHGLPEQVAVTLSRPIRDASTRDEILALVAPDQLPYRVDRGAWSVTLARPGRDERLIDAVPWGDGFVALGGRTVNRHRGSRERIVPTIWVSTDGEAWDEARAPFPEVTDQASSVRRLVVFDGRLYAVGVIDGELGVWRSDDGTGWSSVDVRAAPDGTLPPASGRSVVVGATASAERLVVMTGPWRDPEAGGMVAWTSRDGETWTRSTPEGLDGLVADLSTGPDGFLIRSCLCSGPVERWLLKSSVDGTTWEPAGEAPALSHGVAYDDAAQRYLAATLDVSERGDRVAALDESVDGTRWSRTTTAPGADSIQVSVRASGDTVVMLGSRYAPDDRSSFVMVSRDGGTTWTHSMVPGARHAECVDGAVIGTARIVLLGDCGPNLAWTSRG